MNDQESRAYLTHSPSFRDDATASAESISAVDRSSENESYDDGFEFSVNGAAAGAAAAFSEPADDIFSNGWILPVYPVFNRSLLNSDPDPSEQMQSLAISDLADLRSGSTSSASSADDSVEIGEGSYCKWTPQSSLARCRKSASTGSGSGSGSASSSRWRMRDLLGGRRSRSDGKERFVFLNNPDSNPKPESGANPNPKPKAKAKGEKKKKVVKEMDLVTAHKLFYGKEKREERRSFLPYRQELVGIFANNRVNQFHPF